MDSLPSVIRQVTAAWRLAITVATAVAISSCSTGGVAEPISVTIEPTIRQQTPCADPDQDVASEPDWRRYAEYRDWSRNGCPVRIDVLADRPGPSHCDFESVRVIIMGDPLGARYSTAADDVEYVRDPRNVMNLSAALDTTAELPAAALATGYRSGDEALWIDPSDKNVIYLVTADSIERWPRGEPLLCE